jgi:hypothetical protein
VIAVQPRPHDFIRTGLYLSGPNQALRQSGFMPGPSDEVGSRQPVTLYGAPRLEAELFKFWIDNRDDLAVCLEDPIP